MIDDMTLDRDVALRLERLTSVLERHKPLVVAFSGGVDSALLAFVARHVLGDDMVCAIGISPSLAERDHEDAVAFVRAHDIPSESVYTNEGNDPRYRANNPDRCFYCKDELFQRINDCEALRRFSHVAYGANVDDRSDHRPGAVAARRHAVIAPLVDAGYTKDLVRRTAKALGLEVWDKPAAPCLASRIPYYSEVTPQKLSPIERAEMVLKDLGFRECRVRHHGETTRIEIPIDRHDAIREVWAEVTVGMRCAGFEEVILEPDGLRSGRLNDVLPSKRRAG